MVVRSCWASRRGSAQRNGSAGSGAATVTRCPESDHGFSGQRAGPTERLSAIADPRTESGKPPSTDHELHRARGGGRRAASRGERSSVGHVDRGGRGRQDPAGGGGRGAAGR